MGGTVKHTTTVAVLAAGLIATLTACSSDTTPPPAATETPTVSSPAPAQPPATDTSGLEQAIQAYTTAYFGGDADAAYGALSARCAGKISKEQYGAVVRQAATDYGPDHPATGITAQVSGDLARASYKVQGLPKFSQNGQPWARENGAWHYDAC